MSLSSPIRPLASEVRRRLRFVQVDGENVDLADFPDFLVIGPQRTGSTWLYRNLSRHPQIFMTEEKEIYYFSYLAAAVRQPESAQMSADLSWYLRHFRDTDESRARRQAQCREDHGEDYAPRVRGEASATYAVGVSDDVLQEMTLLNPELKAILMVRHPYERVWSHAKKKLNLDADRPIDDITAADCAELLHGTYADGCSRFSSIIDRWSAALRPDHLFVGDFRDIERWPGELLRRLYGFLGVREDVPPVDHWARRRVCATEPHPIPARVLPLLRERYADELVALRERGFRFDEY